MDIPGIIMNCREDLFISLIIYYKTEKLIKKIYSCRNIQIICSSEIFFYIINQSDSYFDNLAIVILTFIDHFHQDQYKVAIRLIILQVSTSLI